MYLFGSGSAPVPGSCSLRRDGRQRADRGESDDGRRKNEKNPEGAERTIQKGMNRGRRE